MSGPDGRPAALFGFARLASPEQPAPDREAVEAQLAALFGPGAPSPTEVLIVDWRQEPDTAPAGPAARSVLASQAYQLFGHPRYDEASFDGRLHWASTETATVSPGHIEGAMASGERAANTIIGADIARSVPSTTPDLGPQARSES